MDAATARAFIAEHELEERAQKLAGDAPELSDAQLTVLRNIFMNATTADSWKDGE